MFPFGYINPLYFFIALCVGLLYTYITTPPPHIVVKYPTPFNAGQITYLDDAGVCYKYKVEPKQCPSDPKKIKTMPIEQD
jgi:hypothetical protein